ncbi:MAG: MFS transporter [Rhizobiaceae bacterium]|nr:MFS transporter [Rhizobiaceae bacterium]
MRKFVLAIYFIAIFLQSATYGLTFLLPKLFAEFGANEKNVGFMLALTAISTLISVYYSGHLSDLFGRMMTLGISSFSLTLALYLYSIADSVGLVLTIASILIGFGWGLMYTLGPVVLTRLSTPDSRVQIFSAYSVFLMAGFGLSPVFAAYLETLGYGVRDSFWIVAILCVISGLAFINLRGPINDIATTKAPDNRSKLSVPSVVSILTSRAWLPVVMGMLGASVFAGMNNFQTVFAEREGLAYADFFFYYTLTVVIGRVFLARFSGGKSPYNTIALLQFVMAASVVLFIYVNGSQVLYIASAVFFGIGYGVSYPILAAMAANDAPDDLMPQTMQLFSLSYFIGIFGFPLIAGIMIVDVSIPALLVLVAMLAFIEASMALGRHLNASK